MIPGWLSDSVGKVLFLSRETSQNTADIRKLREEVDGISDNVKRLTFETERLKEVGRYERENLMLQLNNNLLQFERRLPPENK